MQNIFETIPGVTPHVAHAYVVGAAPTGRHFSTEDVTQQVNTPAPFSAIQLKPGDTLNVYHQAWLITIEVQSVVPYDRTLTSVGYCILAMRNRQDGAFLDKATITDIEDGWYHNHLLDPINLCAHQRIDAAIRHVPQKTTATALAKHGCFGGTRHPSAPSPSTDQNDTSTHSAMRY